MRRSVILGFILFLVPAVGYASTESEVKQRLDLIRSVTLHADKNKVAEFNKSLDEAWTFFSKNKSSVLPILDRELKAELSKKQRSDLLLLDIGYFLYRSRKDNPAYGETATKSLLSLNYSSDIVLANYKELFEFTHFLAMDKDPRVLPVIEKAFLRRDGNTVFIPQHFLTLNSTLLSSFLYGVYGPESEKELQRLIAEPKLTNKVIEVLIWVGSERSLPQVKKVLARRSDNQTFQRVLAYMMKVGGPDGRGYVLGLKESALEQGARESLRKIRPQVESYGYHSYEKMLASKDSNPTLSKKELDKRLAAMYRNFGKDNETEPMAVLNSRYSKKYLMEKLYAIRARCLHRLSDEALSDVKVTNVLLNALRYRSY